MCESYDMGDKTAMRPFAKLLWTLVLLKVLVSVLLPFQHFVVLRRTEHVVC